MSSMILVQKSPPSMALFTTLHGLLAQAVSTFDEDRDSSRDTLFRAVALLDGGRFRAGSGDSQGGLAPWQAKMAARHIDSNLEGNISVEDLAKMARLSRSRFSKAFKATFRVSPQKFIVERRIERALDIMTTTEEPLSQIAFACGFCDQSHFSRVFRQVTGDSPYAWRRANYKRGDATAADA